MYAARGEGLILIVLLTMLCASTSTPVCCAPDQWEGRLYVEFFVFPYAVHTYGSADVAYDFINSRTVINATLVEESPFADPKKKQYSTLYLEDYTNYYEYELDNGIHCQKTKLDVNLTKQCVQGDDNLLYSGKVGEHIITDTYNITLDKSNPNIRATIERGEYACFQIENTRNTSASFVWQEKGVTISGYAAGNHVNDGGSGSNFLCLPRNPEWKDYTSGQNDGTGRLYGVEYEIQANKPYSKSFNDKDMPCAVCLTARSTVLMVPGKMNCHEGWHKEFSGYLMSEVYKYHTKGRSPSEYICVDEKLDSVPGGDSNRNEAVVYPVEAVCGSLKCPPYVNGRELTCVVCSKEMN